MYSVVMVNNYIKLVLIILKKDGNGRSNDLYIFNVEFNRWLVPPIFSEMDNCCFPSPRQRHTACNFGIICKLIK